MNPSISMPSQNEILPFLRLDGTPQTLEGTPEPAEGEAAVYAGFDLEQASRSGIRWLNLTTRVIHRKQRRA
jgi:hypothetical protein